MTNKFIDDFFIDLDEILKIDINEILPDNLKKNDLKNNITIDLRILVILKKYLATKLIQFVNSKINYFENRNLKLNMSKPIDGSNELIINLSKNNLIFPIFIINIRKKLNGQIEIYYYFKNNFSKDFLKKMFSFNLSSEIYVPYKIFHIYSLLLKKNNEIDLYEFINYIIEEKNLVKIKQYVNYIYKQTNLEKINEYIIKEKNLVKIKQYVNYIYKQTNLEKINEYINNNSRFIKSLYNDKLEYTFESNYSYDYFINKYIISKSILKNGINKHNINSVNLNKFKKSYTDFGRSDFYINNQLINPNANSDKNLTSETKKYYNTIENLFSTFNNKDKEDIIKKILLTMTQQAFSKLSIYYTIFFKKFENNNCIVDFRQFRIKDDKKPKTQSSLITANEVGVLNEKKFKSNNCIIDFIQFHIKDDAQSKTHSSIITADKMGVLNEKNFEPNQKIRKKYYIDIDNNDNINITLICFMQLYFIINDIEFLFLDINYKISIDVLNNTLTEKINFKWKSLIEKKIIRLLYNKNINFDWASSFFDIEKKNMIIINLNEDNKPFNNSDCDKYLFNILIREPLFILVSTQNSTTKFKNGESVSFQHVIKKELNKLGYHYNIKGKNIKNYDSGVRKILGKGVERMRLYKKDNSVNNNKISNVKILQKDLSFGGILFIKFIYDNKKYIFLNTNLSRANNTENLKYIFELFTTDIDFFSRNKNKNNTIKKNCCNLIDLFSEKYNIYLFFSKDISFFTKLFKKTKYTNQEENSKIQNIENLNINNNWKSFNNIKNNFNGFVLDNTNQKSQVLTNLVEDYLKKKIIFNKKRPTFSITQTQKNNMKKYNISIEKIKKEYEIKIYSFLKNIKNINNNILFISSLNNNNQIQVL
jgi:hypothetical protein